MLMRCKKGQMLTVFIILGIIIVYVSLSSFFPHAQAILGEGLRTAQELIK